MSDQDEAVERITGIFPEGDVKDRRSNPNHGYRAVHIIVKVDGFSVEIQVRTDLQDIWAQVMETLGDLVGKEIRYGVAPPSESAQELIDGLMLQSESITEIERLQRELDDLSSDLVSPEQDDERYNEWQDFLGALDTLADALAIRRDRLRSRLEDLLDALEGGRD